MPISFDLRPLVLFCAAICIDAGWVGATPLPAGSASTASEIAAKVAAELERSYVFEDKGHAMAAAVRAQVDAGAWKDLEGEALADAITATCRGVVDDRHLKVRFEDASAPRRVNPFLLDAGAARREWTVRNFGYERAERLQGNVGYLEIREFVPIGLSRATAAAAMTFLQDTDALVIDLRRNGGGDAESVRFLCSYFFGAEPVHLNSLVNREMGHVEEFWTLPEVPGRRYQDKPVFVLIGPKTFSAAEEFAYDLQSRGRAIVVGAKSGGGAHPIDQRQLGGGYSALIPVARAENPVTKTNWEGVGVKPDVETPAEETLDRACSLAFEHLAEQAKDPARRRELQSLLAEKQHGNEQREAEKHGKSAR